MGLTVKRIEKLTARGRYLDERGLYLQVLSPTNRSWLLRYELRGRERWMGLGPLKDFGLEEAREEARKARKLIRERIDPIEDKRARHRQEDAESAKEAAQFKTFEQVAVEYFNHHELKWRNKKHRAQFLSTLRDYAYPHFGKLAVADVDKTLILKALKVIWTDKPETANRVRQRIEAVLNFASASGYRTGENPARWKGHLDQVLIGKAHLRTVKHHRALPFADLPTFMTALRGRDGTAARAVEFTILTAARTSEVTGARWDEIDFEEKVWIVPASRMKAKREHRVPLTEAAIALLNNLPHENANPFVFIGPRKCGLSNMSMDMVLRRMKCKEAATVHGFRSTFRDWAAEVTSFPPDVAEAALAHVTGDQVERAYRRGDVLVKRRKLMEAWARFCDKPSAEVAVLHQKPNKNAA